MSIDFLIVGGGIGGAVLANLLGRRGQRVLVLEKARVPAQQTRPEVLWPATVEVLRTLIPEKLEQRWLLPIRSGVLSCGTQELLRFGSDVFDAAGVQPYSTANTRELLLQQAPCEHQRGAEVTEVLLESGRVVGVRARDTASGTEREILAAWTVGDDGAHSVIRRCCGFPMDVVPFPVEMLAFNFEWPASLPPNAVRVWLNQDRVKTGLIGMPAMPLPEGRGVALLPVWPDLCEQNGRLREVLRSFASQDSVLEELLGPRTDPAGLTRYRLAWSRSPRFGTKGALLLGDAAHPVTPAGGQEANLSVADACFIAKAALETPETLLDEYQTHRLAPTQRSLSLSRRASRVLALPRVALNLGMATLPSWARWLNNRPERFGGFLRTAANAFR
jgi:2-polyprenyl-6-methoxyphenol hydroxylase-like FAD-dependent oxidoreductase